MTSIKVDPNGRILRLTDPELFRYPFIYMVEPGALLLRDEEVPILRRLPAQRRLPDGRRFLGRMAVGRHRRADQARLSRPRFVELPMDHPIFHCVFDLKGPLSKLQTPNERQGVRSQYDGVTWERHPFRRWRHTRNAREMHVRAIFDDKGRMMVLITHNTDNGDGWEREGEKRLFLPRVLGEARLPDRHQHHQLRHDALTALHLNFICIPQHPPMTTRPSPSILKPISRRRSRCEDLREIPGRAAANSRGTGQGDRRPAGGDRADPHRACSPAAIA